MKRCPVCFGWINQKASKCRHCQSVIDTASNDDDYLEYINHGFSLIERECMLFDEKSLAMEGSIFPRHVYSEEELINSTHLEKITSIANKMGDDIKNWKMNGKISMRVENLYESRIYNTRNHIDYMVERLKSRRATLWERFSEIFMAAYYFIFSMALASIKGMPFPNIKTPDKYKKPLKIINKTFNDLQNSLEGNDYGEEECEEKMSS